MINWARCQFDKTITLNVIRSSLNFSVENNIFTIDYLSTIASIPQPSDEIEESSPSKKKRRTKSFEISTNE